MTKTMKIMAVIGLIMAFVGAVLLVQWIWLGGLSVVLEIIGLVLFVASYDDSEYFDGEEE